MERRGRIELILGPMFAGKTAELIRRLRRYRQADLNTYVIAQKGSNRYASETEESKISTHDRESIPADFLVDGTSLMSLKNESAWNGCDIVAIDEGQFFFDLCEFSSLCASRGKTVIVAALNGDFRGVPWDSVSRLIPMCQNIRLLTAVCDTCHEDNAVLSSRITECTNDNRVLIGGKNFYVPLCLTCRDKKESSTRPPC